MPTDSDVITACLTYHNIKNFTAFPNSGTDSSEYYKLLNFSLQNLRFAEPSFSPPAAIILPESRDELVRSIECCRKGSWEIRVRCGGHSYEGTSSVTTDGDPFTTISLKGVTTLIDMLEEEPKGYVILDPYGGIMQDISSEAIAFPHRKGNIFSIQYLVEWYEEDHEKGNEYLAWMRKLYDSMTPFVSSGPRAAYVNYMDLDLGVMDLVSPGDSSGAEAVEWARAWGEKYFLKNYDRLVRAKTYIDPNNVFKHQQGIPPMLTSGSKSKI
ncbi:FAD linked oxidase, N-terminal [Dillenia turbinata]|uniref:FAD linked oxidase, N-terminal n=1 Tax=Dillenia turbinata TaxID=194707 RepID=A0AAN8VU97_9MAGN